MGTKKYFSILHSDNSFYNFIYYPLRYQTKETIVRENIRPTSDSAKDTDMPFIDLIICPSFDVSYKKENLYPLIWQVDLFMPAIS